GCATARGSCPVGYGRGVPRAGRSPMSDVALDIRCAGMINGEIVTVEGEGRGSVDRGTLEMRFAFSAIPDGFSIYCASLWTACCSSPTFAIARDGGLDMLTIGGARSGCD